MQFTAIIPQDLRITASPSFNGLTITGITSLEAGLVCAIETISVDATLTLSHYTILISASGVNVTATLPSLVATGQVFNLKCIDNTYTATVDGNGYTIDGAATVSLALHESITIQFNGTEWWIL